MMRSNAIYKALLHCYPAAFRHEYGDQMLLMFAEQLGEAGGRREQAALWLDATLDALIVAPREHWHMILQDLRYALRIMAARPIFPAVAILSLALGIGANTAIFGLWNGVLHAALPAVDKPDQLVMLSNPNESGSWTGRWDGRTDGPRSWLSYGEFEDLRDHASSFSALMASQSSLNRWQVRFDGGAWEETRGRFVSGGFFQVLGIRPAIGRLFTTTEDRVEAPYGVISHNYWKRRFAASPDVLGKTFTLHKTAVTIIGVTPPGFVGETSGQQPDLWLPLLLQPSLLPDQDRLHDSPPVKQMWLHVFGRLKPGVMLAEAEAHSNAIFQAGLESFYGAAASGERRREYLDQHIRIQSGSMGASPIRNEFHHSLTALLAAVGVLLLIACANLANLLLARNAARKHEIAVRVSLGASRERLIRQLITESLVLAAMGGAAAIAVAYFLHAALVRMIAESDPRFKMIFDLDPIVLAFVVAATLAAALLFGVLPALQITKSSTLASLNEQGRGTGSSRGEMRSSRLLVSVQLALCLPLLTGAGLLARTVYNLQRADLGFQADHLLLVRTDLEEVTKDRVRRDNLADELLGEIQRISGVRAASFSQLGVFSGGESSDTIEVEGYTPSRDDDRGSKFDVVSPGYFSTLGIPILLGREILASDGDNASRVCVVNEAFARRFFSGRNPVGMHITSLADDSRTTYQVVGVARNAHTQSLRGNVEPRCFVAFKQQASAGNPTFMIRTAGETASIARVVNKTTQRVEPALPILSSTSIEEQMAPLMAQDRTTAQLAIVFGCVALVLASVGLYGVLSYGVARRTGEIAIRIALGARPGRVVSMVLRETTVLVAAGLAMGGGLAYGFSRLIDSRLYGVAPEDPLTLALATGLLLLVALAAAYLPARRASRVDPMAALRQG